MTGRGHRRAYRRVDVAGADDGHAVRLDGRAARTPGRAALVLPTAALARAVAAEWEAQGERIDPRAMPLTALACRALDLDGPGRERLVETLAAYAGSDLLCYRAERPAALVAQQHARWQPLLDWAATALDAPLRVTAGIVPVAQPAAALAACRAAIAGRDDMALAALDAAVRAAGSLVLGLALAAGRLDAAAATAAACLEENWQAEQWGRDGDAQARLDAIAAEVESAARFMALAGAAG